MTRFLFFLCALPALFSAAAPPDDPGPGSLTADTVTRAVLAHNHAVAEARAKWEATRQRIPQAAAWDDPRVSMSSRLERFVSVSPNSFTDQMVSVEQMIPLSGKNRSRARIAAAESVVAFEEFRRRQLDQVAQARAAYYRLARGYALLELNHASEESLQQTVEVARAKLGAGSESSAELLAAESEQLRLQEITRDLRLSLTEEQTHLRVLMGASASISQPKPSSLVIASTCPDLDRLEALMLNDRPEIRMADASLLASKAKLELARREWIPDPSISLQAQRYNASQAVSEIGAGVSFSVPWVNAGKYRAGEQEAASEVAAAEQAQAQARLEAREALRLQWEKLETLRHHGELFTERLVPLARTATAANLASFQNGSLGLPALIQAQQAQREIEAGLAEHLADTQIALAEFEALIGSDLCAPKSVGGKDK